MSDFTVTLDEYEFVNLMHALTTHPCLNSGDWYMQVRHQLAGLASRFGLNQSPNPLYCQRGRNATPQWLTGFHVDEDYDGTTYLVHHERKCGWSDEWDWRTRLSLKDFVEAANAHAAVCPHTTSIVPDHLPDNDESRGHEPVR